MQDVENQESEDEVAGQPAGQQSPQTRLYPRGRGGTESRTEISPDMETKICGQCGKTYERPYGMSRSQFATRKYCSMQCRAEAAHNNRPNANPRIWEGRFRERECECGAPATETIWVIQFGADDTPARQYIECCTDCRDLFLETDPGAMLEKPERPRWEDYNRCIDKVGQDYNAPAHMASWHRVQGARP